MNVKGNAEMQINKILNTQTQNFLEEIAPKDANTKNSEPVKTTLTVDAQCLQYVSEALNTSAPDDADKIEQARKLLASGALDTPEAARIAAENMLKFGI